MDRRKVKVFFFFQAEDGIRGGRVTGVQTCALPICTVDRICAFPESGAKFSASTRGRIAANFPFWVIYRADSAEVTIIAIAHQRRKPGYWQKRKNAPR